MNDRSLAAQPLTRTAFASFGDVIQRDGAEHFSVNAGSMDRFHELAQVEVDHGAGGRPVISIFRALEAASFPLQLNLMERHPLGSQAFVPLGGQRFVVVVAPAESAPGPDDLRAFLTDGTQGVNYRHGVWHMPLVAFEKGQEFLVVDRAGPGGNYEEIQLPETVTVVAGTDSS